MDIRLFQAVHQAGAAGLTAHQLHTAVIASSTAATNDSAAASFSVTQLTTLLTALASIGLLLRNPTTGCYTNSPGAEAFLSKKNPRYDYGDYLRFQIDKQMFPFMANLNAIVTGRPSEQKFVDYADWM